MTWRPQLCHFVAAITIAVLAIAGAFFFTLMQMVRHVDRTIDPLAQHLTIDLEDVHHATLEIGLTSENLRKATAAWQESSHQQSAYFTAAAAQTQRDLADLDKTVLHLSAVADSLNDTIVDQQGQLDGVEQQAKKTLADLDASAVQLGPVLSSTSAAAANAAKLTADPHLAKTLANLDTTSANVASITKNMDASSADVRAFIHRETTPVRGTWNVIKGFLMEFAGPAASVATAAK